MMWPWSGYGVFRTGHREEVVKTYVMVIGLTKKPIEIDKHAGFFRCVLWCVYGGFSGVVKPIISRSCLEMGELSGTWLYSEWNLGCKCFEHLASVISHWHDQKNLSGRHQHISPPCNFTWQRKIQTLGNIYGIIYKWVLFKPARSNSQRVQGGKVACKPT